MKEEFSQVWQISRVPRYQDSPEWPWLILHCFRHVSDSSARLFAMSHGKTAATWVKSSHKSCGDTSFSNCSRIETTLSNDVLCQKPLQQLQQFTCVHVLIHEVYPPIQVKYCLPSPLHAFFLIGVPPSVVVFSKATPTTVKTKMPALRNCYSAVWAAKKTCF